MEDIGWCDPTEHGLRSYVEAIARTLGVGPESTCCEVNNPSNAYLALPQHLPGYAGRDLALIWDDIYGWAAAVETGSGEDLLVLAYCGDDVLPQPVTVVDFVRRLLNEGPPGRLHMPTIHGREDLAARLASYGTHPLAGS